jgi:hypothetical protein
VSLLILPAIINMADGDLNTDPNGASLAIAGASIVVLVAAVAFSKRPAPGLAGGDAPSGMPSPVPATSAD